MTKEVISLEQLRARRKKISENTEKTLSNMQIIRQESVRVAKVAHDSKKIIDNLEKEFEAQTKLDKTDIAFLFLATALHCARIYLFNKLTKIEGAGQKNKIEKNLHKLQKKISDLFDDGNGAISSCYYASLNHIITTQGVPYDASAFLGENTGLLRGANHRFSTLGHDPVVGLIFGTANILTNTITCFNKPIITSNHVFYDCNLKNPKIGMPALTSIVLEKSIQRCDGDIKSVVAALIKQIIHIGTDMYTPCGIQIPLANIFLDKKTVEKITKHISYGDLVKIGTSMKIASFIDIIVGTFHSLFFNDESYSSFDVYNIKTRKIIDYAYLLATGSNVIANSFRIYKGDSSAIKDIDFAGIIILLGRIFSDYDYQLKIKEEFVLGGLKKQIRGEELELTEV